MERATCKSELKALPFAETHWFAVQAHSRAEAAAEFGLRSLSIETLLPLVRRPVHHARRAARHVVRALFPGYLFARFCVAESLRAVTFSRGVVRVLGAGGRPVPVEDSIIASIRERIGEHGCVALDERRFGVRDCVRIISGPLAGWSGVFERELSDSQRVVILIETLQQGRVVISRDLLELSDAA
jgi:transcriptional antiterminator RfaH